MGWGKAVVMKEGRAGQDLLLSTCGLLIAAAREVSRANTKSRLLWADNFQRAAETLDRRLHLAFTFETCSFQILFVKTLRAWKGEHNHPHLPDETTECSRHAFPALVPGIPDSYPTTSPPAQ